MWIKRGMWLLVALATVTVMHISLDSCCEVIDEQELSFPLIKPLLQRVEQLIIPVGIIKTTLLLYISRRNSQDNWLQYILPLHGDAASTILYIVFYSKLTVIGIVITISVLNRSLENFFIVVFCVACVIKSSLDFMVLIAIIAVNQHPE